MPATATGGDDDGNPKVPQAGIGDARMSFLVKIFQAFLDDAGERQFVVLEDDDARDQYIQFKRNRGVVYGEVASREWEVPERCRPLSPAARLRLATEGFTHGGPMRNYVCDNLAQSAPYLAHLYLKLHVLAFQEPAARLPGVLTEVASVQAAAGERLRPFATPSTPVGRKRRLQLREAPVRASPGLKLRVERALRSNFGQIASNHEEREALKREVEQAGDWDGLPGWVKGWIKKAEEGPLWVRL